MDEEEAEVVWQEVLDAVVSGREQGIRCPFCQKGQIAVERSQALMRLECSACRRFIEGQWASD